MSAVFDTAEGRAVDQGFARWVLARSGDPALARAAFAASAAEGAGHACARLRAEAGFDDATLAALARSAWVGRGDAFTPFVLDDDNFYTWRYWKHERELAAALLTRVRARRAPQGAAAAAVAADATRLFAVGDAARAERQREAAVAVVGARVCVLTGGPGTGKTTTVLRMLALLLRHAVAHGAAAAPSIALAAPTGKAAQRLAQSIAEGREQLRTQLSRTPQFAALVERIPAAATTLHRLLGFRPYDDAFAYGAGAPLPADVVVVDEASMVDLALMRQLFDALRPDATVILVGDADQLWSVAAGSVLADIVAELEPAGAVVRLTEVFRAGSALSRSIAAVRAADADWLEQLVAVRRDGDLTLLRCAAAADLRARVDAWIEHHEAVFGALRRDGIDPDTALGCLGRAQVLCALSAGDFGAATVDALIARRLGERHGFDAAAAWYHGRPVLITRNDPARGLFNGDVGIALRGAGGLRVWFRRDADRGLRDFAPRALPACIGAWAITIHRAQGSEYDAVAVLLPPDPDNRILTRQLLYTGVSRARRQVELWASDDSLRAAVNRPIERHGGLRRRLRAPASAAAAPDPAG